MDKSQWGLRRRSWMAAGLGWAGEGVLDSGPCRSTDLKSSIASPAWPLPGSHVAPSPLRSASHGRQSVASCTASASSPRHQGSHQGWSAPSAPTSGWPSHPSRSRELFQRRSLSIRPASHGAISPGIIVGGRLMALGGAARPSARARIAPIILPWPIAHPSTVLPPKQSRRGWPLRTSIPAYDPDRPALLPTSGD